MQTKTRRSLLHTLCFVTALTVISHIAYADGPYTIKYKFTEGQVEKYAMTMNNNTAMTVNGSATNTKSASQSTVSSVVQKVNLDGSAILQSTYQINSMVVNGTSYPVPTSLSTPQVATMTMSPVGKVLSMTMPASSQVGKLMPSSMFSSMPSFLPNHPVSIGDSWTDSMNIPTVNITMNIVLTLTSVTQQNGSNIAEISGVYTTPTNQHVTPSTSPVPINISSMNGTSKTDFDIDRGSLVGTNFTMNMSMAMPSSATAKFGPINVTTTMNMTQQNGAS